MLNIDEFVQQLKTDIAYFHQTNIIDAEYRIFYQKYFGRQGLVRNVYQSLGKLSSNERKKWGSELNELREQAQRILENLKIPKTQNFASQADKIDVTLDVIQEPTGSFHPLHLLMMRAAEVLNHLGYEIVSGQEVETEEYNFEKLNLPEHHVARNMHDSLYFSSKILLRTHSTNVTARYISAMSTNKPLRIASIGNVYRKDDDDATHSHQFTQIDVVNLGTNINMTNLRGTLEYFLTAMFECPINMRFRSGYFPFTEPSIEVDICCFHCNGIGCDICKQKGWLEILGAGMVHPNVLWRSNHDPSKIQGFAFGIGLERLAMIKYGVTDIRYFYDTELRFLSQFTNEMK